MLARPLIEKRNALRRWLQDTGGCVVAFSGGVDSTLLLAEAVSVLGERVLALTAMSANHAQWERDEASALVKQLGVRHRFVEAKELENPEFTANPTERCYICKKGLFHTLWEIARQEGFRCLADGSNTDDRGDFRPGRRALRELGVSSPLEEVGLSKQEIRRLSEFLNLPTWDKPGYACLSSRIPYGTPITSEVLGQVERAEDSLRALGLRVVRVRHHGNVARLELGDEEFGRVAVELREEVCKRVREAGYAYVTLDLHGYRSGALNEVLAGETRGETL